MLVSGIVEEALADQARNPFPQVISTERPDKMAMWLLQGCVGVLVDGLPLGYITPAVFSSFFRDPADYSQYYLFNTSIRILRYFLFIATLLIPAFYIAVTSFHIEMIPAELAVFIQKSREGVPLPSFVEVLIMLVAAEILAEAGMRMPKGDVYKRQLQDGLHFHLAVQRVSQGGLEDADEAVVKGDAEAGRVLHPHESLQAGVAHDAGHRLGPSAGHPLHLSLIHICQNGILG